MRGRLPKPTKLRLLEGKRGHRPVRKNEPTYPPTIPVRPKKLSREARAVWDELVSEMAAARVLAAVDKNALWGLSEDEALLKQAYSGLLNGISMLKREAAKAGKPLSAGPFFSLISTKSGRLAMATLRDLRSAVMIQRREFGLTPSSRARISISAGDSVDALEAKLCG